MSAVSNIKEKVKKVFSDEQAEVINEIVDIVDQTVKVKDFNELKDIVRDIAIAQKELAEAQKRTEQKVEELAEAQKRTEQKVEELAEAQKRTEQRVEELAEAQKRTEQRVEELAEAQKRTEQRVEELAEAQKRTEQRVEELAEAQKRTEQKVEELAEAQKRTEQKVEELAEAQKRTEQRVEELAEAQKRTEEELKELIKEHQKTREQIGGLSGTVGYYLEDLSYPSLPIVLKEDIGLEVEGYLERRFIEYPDGGEDEINIFGKGRIDGKQLYIVGEAKSQIGKRDVELFVKVLKRVREYFGKDVLPVMVCYMIHPKVEKYIKEKHPEIFVYKSFELKRRADIK